MTQRRYQETIRGHHVTGTHRADAKVRDRIKTRFIRRPDLLTERHCLDCGAILSRYNPKPICWVHQAA